jgi:hypothetical protein
MAMPISRAVRASAHCGSSAVEVEGRYFVDGSLGNCTPRSLDQGGSAMLCLNPLVPSTRPTPPRDRDTRSTSWSKRSAGRAGTDISRSSIRTGRRAGPFKTAYPTDILFEPNRALRDMFFTNLRVLKPPPHMRTRLQKTRGWKTPGWRRAGARHRLRTDVLSDQA